MSLMVNHGFALLVGPWHVMQRHRAAYTYTRAEAMLAACRDSLMQEVQIRHDQVTLLNQKLTTAEKKCESLEAQLQPFKEAQAVSAATGVVCKLGLWLPSDKTCHSRSCACSGVHLFCCGVSG